MTMNEIYFEATNCFVETYDEMCILIICKMHSFIYILYIHYKYVEIRWKIANCILIDSTRIILSKINKSNYCMTVYAPHGIRRYQ